MKKYIVSGGALLLAPSIALAGTGFTGVIGVVKNLINLAVPVVISLAVLYFLWGLAQYLWKNEEKDEGKDKMIWGIIALFVMVSIWGLVGLLSDTFLKGATTQAPNVQNLVPTR